MAKKPTSKKKKADAPIGIEEIDRLRGDGAVTLGDYLRAVSAYVRRHGQLPIGAKKAAQIRLSNALGRALANDLEPKLPEKRRLFVGERKVAGGLRTVNADVSESHELDGLRIAVEIKPINLAVGRAIWNRFGDLRAFAVNIHLKFPFCVVGGVLVIPTAEETGTRQAKAASEVEEAFSTEDAADSIGDLIDPLAALLNQAPLAEAGTYKSTHHLIRKAVTRLIRARGRATEADAAHQLEAIAVIAYDPLTGKIDDELPASDSGLRWDNFIDDLAAAYSARFE